MFKGEKTFPLVLETGKENESYKYQNRWAKSVLVTNDVTMYTEIKLTKIKHKEQILKAAKEKKLIIYKGVPIRLTEDLSTEALWVRRE